MFPQLRERSRQNAHLALDMARTGYVLQAGRVVREGDTAEMKNSEVVRRAYPGA